MFFLGEIHGIQESDKKTGGDSREKGTRMRNQNHPIPTSPRPSSIVAESFLPKPTTITAGFRAGLFSQAHLVYRRFVKSPTPGQSAVKSALNPCFGRDKSSLCPGEGDWEFIASYIVLTPARSRIKMFESDVCMSSSCI